MAEPVAYIEIEKGVLVCTCGGRTEVPGNEMGLVAQPHQQCATCGKIWWAAGSADCEEPESIPEDVLRRFEDDGSE